MTKELANDIFRKCSQDLDVKQFNFSELINNLLLIYAQNDQCVDQGPYQNGGNPEDRRMFAIKLLGWIMLVLSIMLSFALYKVWSLEAAIANLTPFP
jgi:hypothetical protein